MAPDADLGAASELLPELGLRVAGAHYVAGSASAWVVVPLAYCVVTFGAGQLHMDSLSDRASTTGCIGPRTCVLPFHPGSRRHSGLSS